MNTYPYSFYETHVKLFQKIKLDSNNLDSLKPYYCHFCSNTLNIDSFKLSSRIAKKIKKMSQSDTNKLNYIKLARLLKALCNIDKTTTAFIDCVYKNVFAMIKDIEMSDKYADEEILNYISYYNDCIECNKEHFLNHNISCDLCGRLSCHFHQKYGTSKVVLFEDNEKSIKKYVCDLCIYDLDEILEEDLTIFNIQ